MSGDSSGYRTGTAGAAPVREGPLIFSGPKVRYILSRPAGELIQTRRVITPQPAAGVRYRMGGGAVEDGHGRPINPRYGVPGDRLWVRETWAHDAGSALCEDHRCGMRHHVWYRASEKPSVAESFAGTAHWRPSIYMPRWASRITLELTEVRVQRLQEISEEDAKAEGAIWHDGGGIGHSGWRHDQSDGYVWGTARESFRRLWDSINDKRGYSWDTNPWVWCLTFRRLAWEVTNAG